MDRINGAYVDPNLFGAGKDGFKDGNKTLGVAATIVNAEYLNNVQEELCNVIEPTGIVLDTNDRTQLKQAIRIMLSGADVTARFTTTANINLNGLGTQAGGDWSSGLTAGDIIFPKNQTTASQNGWYVAAAGAWTRVKWLDESVEVKPAMITKVSEGATLADTTWMLITDATITLGTTNLAFAQFGAANVAPGCVAHYAQSTAPAGWLKANGAAVSRTTYAALFAAIGTGYGVGDGSTTFNLPDARGEFIRGFDDGRGIDSGRTIGSWQKGSYASLGTGPSNDLVATYSTGNGSAGRADLGYDAVNLATDFPNARISYNTPTGIVTPTDTDQSYGSSRPRNVAYLACIKY